MDRYTGYDDFAFTYNRHWGLSWQNFGPVMDHILFNGLSAGSRILDLCCGTGQMAHHLHERGFTVTGLDASEKQLEFARRNAPFCDFILADARDFKVPGIFDAVISVYDSLNHIPNPKALGRVFRNAYAALAEGGMFVFDLNMEDGYNKRWKGGSFHILDDDHVALVQPDYDPEKREAVFDAVVFIKQEHWERSDIHMVQHCYRAADVRSALRKSGFARVEAFAFVGREGGLVPLKGEGDRAFFTGVK